MLPIFLPAARRWIVIFTPAIAFLYILNLKTGSYLNISFFGFDLTLLRVDKLSKVFGYIFTIYGFATGIYSFYLKDLRQQLSGLIYMGGALGVVFSGDIITLYFYWELMAVASVILILARETNRAIEAGYRYILVHILGGLCLLAGIVMYISQGHSVEFSKFTEHNPATYLILIGFLLNAAAPPLGAWLPDAYPESTPTGSVILSAYTTKTAVYTLLRGFPGWEILIFVGCLMSIYGIFYALLENDMRRILAYSIINQVGFMICGAGIGTAMAINGAAAHAFAHIVYKGLLFMSAGAVLYMTGKSKCTELGGLYKTMPYTLLFGCIGALSISAFPLTSGFTTKSMIIESSVHQHLMWAWLILEVASAGVFLHAGIKFPYFVFFAKDRGLRPGETNKSMLIAMAFLSFICIFLGVYPKPLYKILPYSVGDYNAYTAPHLITQLQLLMFSALVFFLFLPMLKRTDTISLDTDWFYRKGGRLLYVIFDKSLNTINYVVDKFVISLVKTIAGLFSDFIANIALFIFVNIWLFKGVSGKKLEIKKETLYYDIKEDLLPVGIGAAISGIFLVLIFLLGKTLW
ncbi:Na(+)/H(+) antiporter subunit D [Desulfothermus okinawensis JCM 13304]